MKATRHEEKAEQNCFFRNMHTHWFWLSKLKKEDHSMALQWPFSVDLFSLENII